MGEGRVVGVGRDPDAAGYAAEVPVGYRRTDIGVIPDDWEVVLAGDIGRFGSGSGFPVRYQGAAQGDHPFFKVSDMSRDGNELLLKECPNYIADDTRRLLGASLFPAQSITFAKVGAAVFLERKRILAQPSCVDNNMAAFELTDERADTLFAYYWLLSIRLSSFANTTALPSLSSTALCGLVLPLPNLPEQRAIAAVLSDVDELVEQLEALLAKKRAIKQAAMQQLVTGKTRLTGFGGEWETRHLRSDISLLSGHHVMAHDCNTLGLGLPYLTGPADFPEGRIQHTKFTTKPTTICRAGDILVTVKGSGSGTLVEADADYCISRQLMAIRPTRTWNPTFLLYSLLQNASRIKAASTGLIPGLSRSDILDQSLPAPNRMEEQRAIATILSDMDAEIAALEHRLDKTRAIKQGMMQQLLTGAIRLPIPDTAPHENAEP